MNPRDTANAATALRRPRKCERCHLREWDDLWSPDGLPGHEILVCRECWHELEEARDDDA